MALRITHLSFSSAGGAGTVARRLAEIQTSLGHSAHVRSIITGSLRSQPLRSPLHTVAASIDEFVIRDKSFDAPISLMRDGIHESLASAFENSDVLHIHWPHGVLDWQALDRSFGGAIVWTLHDMRPFTGACHYSLGCEGFTSGCRDCPAVKSVWAGRVSSQFATQHRVINQLSERVHFVSPSQWLADTAQRSQILRGAQVRVIPNPLPLNPPAPGTTANRWPDIPKSATIFVAAASGIDDPVKDITSAISAFVDAVEESENVWLLIAGAGRTQDSGHSRVRFLGELGPEEMAHLMSKADYLLVPSLAENQPLLISEAQSHGVCVIVRDSTGLSEHTVIDPSALLFRTGNELTGLIRTVKSSRVTGKSRRAVSHAAQRKFDPLLVAQQYLELYSEATPRSQDGGA